MNRYHGEWQADIRHGKGVQTEQAEGIPRKYHVEYEGGKLKVKSPMALSELCPRGLSYKDGEVIVSVGDEMQPNTCSVSGKGPFSFAVDPPLPDALSINPMTGTISGTVNHPVQQALVTVTCQNQASRNGDGKPATVDLKITVLENIIASGFRTKEYTDASVYTGPSSTRTI